MNCIQIATKCDVLKHGTPLLKDSLLSFKGKKLLRLERTTNNSKARSVGVCVHVTSAMSAHCTLNVEITRCTPDYEIICINITKPGLKHNYVNLLFI